MKTMDLKEKKWKLVVLGSDDSIELRCEDDSIFTEDNHEVLGCSEWLRCDEDIMRYIVDLHNSRLDNA